MSLLQITSRCLALAGLSALALAVFAHIGTDQPRRIASSVSHASTAGSTSSAFTGAAVRPMLASLSGAPTTTSALPLAQAGSDPLTVEPRVPRAAGTPCVVELVHSAHFSAVEDSTGYLYTPPAGCPGPWSKVRLVVDLTGPRPRGAPNANIEITFFNGSYYEGIAAGAGPLLVGAPQEHALLPLWRLERDLTEYAAMLTQPQVAHLLTTADNSLGPYEDEFISVLVRSVRLVFYPATAQTPAPRVADAVYATTYPNTYPVDVPTPVTLTLPRNIERAYLDVYAQALNNGGYFGIPGRFWYSCVPQAAATAYPTLHSKVAIGDERLPDENSPDQGCIGGSYREVEVRIDGQLAGLAPLYPWLPSGFHGSVVDDPAPSVQALNFMPYRVDLTPFAALLGNGAEHTVQTIIAAAEPAGPTFVRGQLLVYLDHGKTQVTGAVTRNTLDGHPAAPTVQDGLTLSGGTLQGNIVTTSRRQYLIEGYVDTSHGRIRSSVWQDSQFANTQAFLVQDDVPDFGLHDYRQNIRMSNTVQRVSRRFRGDTLLSEDRGYVSYPLSLDYHGLGNYDCPDSAVCEAFILAVSVKVNQARRIRGAHYRRGMPRYATNLNEVFDASRARDFLSSPPQDSDWFSTRKYLFKDTLGSCYHSALATTNGELTRRTRGVACPNGKNHVRWFAHADGSPDGLGWAPQGP